MIDVGHKHKIAFEKEAGTKEGFIQMKTRTIRPLRKYTSLSAGGWLASGQQDVGHEGVATGRRGLSLPSPNALWGLTYAFLPQESAYLSGANGEHCSSFELNFKLCPNLFCWIHSCYLIKYHRCDRSKK